MSDCQNQNVASFLVQSAAALSNFQCKPNQTAKAFVKKSSLTKILMDWGGLFHDINIKNNGAIVMPRFSTLCG